MSWTSIEAAAAAARLLSLALKTALPPPTGPSQPAAGPLQASASGAATLHAVCWKMLMTSFLPNNDTDSIHSSVLSENMLLGPVRVGLYSCCRPRHPRSVVCGAHWATEAMADSVRRK